MITRATSPNRDFQFGFKFVVRLGGFSGETHISLAERAPHARERLVARNRLNEPLTDFVAAPPGLGSPELINSVDLGGIKALDEAVSQKGARLAGQRQGLLSNLIDGPWHKTRIVRFGRTLKPSVFQGA